MSKRLLLGLALALGLVAPARADFVTDNSSLPATKTNLHPLPRTADPTKYIQASDYNALAQAALDLRTALVGGAYHGLMLLAADPAPSNATNYLWMDLAHLLHLHTSGTNYDVPACLPTTTGDVCTWDGSGWVRGASNSVGVINGVINVKDAPYNATGDGTTDDTAAVQAAVTAWAASTGTLYFPPGTYKYTTGIAFPMATDGRHAIVLDGGATLDYRGTGYAIEALGAGNSQANVSISGGTIVGTASGAGGIHLNNFSGGKITGVYIRGFTAGDGIFVEGVDTVDFIGCSMVGNLNGYHSVGIATGSSNANRVLGGHIASNTGWGIFEDGAVSAPGPAIRNVYSTTLEINGSGATGGNVFIQQGDEIVVNSYFEYTAGTYGPYQIVVGDSTHHPTNTVIQNCHFGTPSASTATIQDYGASTIIQNNIEVGAVNSLIESGVGSTGRYVGRNTAASVPNLLTGTDNGDTLDFGSSLNLLSSIYPSSGGVAFRAISGHGAPIVIGQRAGQPIEDILDYHNSVGASVGGVLAGGGVWMGDGSAASVSSANTGAIRYNNTTHTIQQSVNGGAWVDIGSGGGSGYSTIDDEGTPLTQRSTVNFTGAGVSCVDNAGASRTDCTISGNVAAVALTDGATVTTDGSVGNVFTVTLGGNRTLANPTNLVAGGTYMWIVTQDATGSRTLSYGSAFAWSGGTAPTLTTTAGAVDMITAVYDGTKLRSVFAGDLR